MLTLTVKPTDPVFADQGDDLSGHAHRQLIGYIGLVLPFLLIALALARDGMDRWRALRSAVGVARELLSGAKGPGKGPGA